MRVEIEIGSDEWKRVRRELITATDAPAIMSISSWNNPQQLFQRKRSGEEISVNPHMKRGLEMESEARSAFEEIVQHPVSPSFHISDTHPWAAASFDGINESMGTLVEIKCLGIKNHEKVVRGNIPKEYVCQCQHQMFVSGFNRVHFFSYHPDHDQPMSLRFIERDDEFIKEMVEKEMEFYECLKKGVMPKADLPKQGNDSFLYYESMFVECKEEFDAIKEKMEEYREILGKLSGGKEMIGNLVKVTPFISGGIIDYAKIPELQGVDLSKYRKIGKESFKVSVL